MRREEQSKLVNTIKAEIDSKLIDLDLYKIKDLVLWMLQSPKYQNVKTYDDQLIRLDMFVNIWRQEKSDLNSFEMQGDVFAGVKTLEDINQKYNCAKMAIWRIENEVPYEYCIEAVDCLTEYQYSAYALYCILLKESKNHERNLLILARLFSARKQIVKAIGLLQLGLKKFPRNTDMAIELADLWLEVGQIERAYICLAEIEKPTNEIQEIKQELEMLITK